MLYLKPGVRVAGLQPEILIAISAAEGAFRDIANSNLTITSGLDGHHMEGSRHYVGQAVDLRTRHIAKWHIDAIKHRLELALGPDYDIVVEKTHLHIEFDPKPE